MSSNVKEGLITVIISTVRGCVPNYEPLLVFFPLLIQQNTGSALKCPVLHSLLANQHLHFFHRLTIPPICMRASSSSGPMTVHSVVAQWWTVKYHAVFLSQPHSGTQGQKTMTEPRTQRRANKSTGKAWFLLWIRFSSYRCIIMFPFYFTFLDSNPGQLEKRPRPSSSSSVQVYNSHRGTTTEVEGCIRFLLTLCMRCID